MDHISVEGKNFESPTALSPNERNNYVSVMEQEQMVRLNNIKNILDIEEELHPEFILAKNRLRFKKKLSWYKAKKDWLDIAPIQKINKLFKQQTKELETIRSNKLDYQMELETISLTPHLYDKVFDELKMCRAHEKMAIQLITKMQIKFKSRSSKGS
ncbi:MAG: hypothetical protein ACR2M7_04355 [Bdellovibrionales bacterium]